jgi:rSAM/selenodomain-associated transferase 1
MAEYTIRVAGNSLPSIAPIIYYDGATEEKTRAWLGEAFAYRSQTGEDLGQKMRAAFAEGFDGGATAIVLIGTDCPGLDRQTILEAFDHLNSVDLVLGPARDGGYYLIGLTRLYPKLFEGIAWGTERVLANTIKIATELNLSVAYLHELNDIDRPEDLADLDRSLLLGLDDHGSSRSDKLE